ncbi:d5ba2019-c712-4546-a4b8-1d695d3082fd [Sclerotinia trifoliorum]|uniref:D5ba2019-c712-4546-a4b8-1d695d3082fd n=1 Tax=Sclerotinia trifoliorum TaxID=28548 RepID=A0A8H2W2P6_9HELO|nr:d5ba2019-c712-4546-a4b8-1d695d3082fd [Sclerotinia trifoliorum]
MATPRGPKHRSYLPTPPTSPDQFQSPPPLPLPTKMTRLESWKSARSRSLDLLENKPVIPTPLRVVSAPVISTISSQITRYDRSSSPDPVTEPEVEADLPNRYTTSYYNILGLPESPSVTRKDIEEAYNNLVGKPSNYSQETLQQIHKTLTNSIRRRTYDLGRRAHLLRQTHLIDRERFEKKMSGDFFQTQKGISEEAKEFVDNLKVENLKKKMEIVKRELAENVEKKIRFMGLSMNMDGVNEEEGVPWEEMDFGVKGAEPIGERLSLDFEFAGSGSEEDSDEENRSGGTFSEREEEKEETETVGESKEIEECKEAEELSVSAMTVPVLEATDSYLEITPAIAKNTSKNDEQESAAKADKEDVLNIPRSTFKIDEVLVKMRTETDLPNITTTIDLLFPPPTPRPIPILVSETKPKPKPISCKEIWEFDYNSEIETDTETETEIDGDGDGDSNTDTDTDTEIEIEDPTSTPSPSNSTNNTKTNTQITSVLPLHPSTEPDPDLEIWEPSYTDNNTNNSQANEETILLSTYLLAAIWVAITFWAWFGYVGVAA